MSENIQFIKNQMTRTQRLLRRKNYDWDLIWEEYCGLRGSGSGRELELRNLLVLKNQPFAFSKAAEYFSKYPHREADIVEAAFEGLFPAVEAFDLSKGYQFSTYAYWWIRQRISAEIGLGDIKTTAEFRLLRGKVYKLIEAFKSQGREVDPDQVANLLGEDIEKVKEAMTLPIVVSLHESDGDSEESDCRINLVEAPETWKDQLDRIQEEFQAYNVSQITHPQLLTMFDKVKNGQQLCEADIIFLDSYNDSRFLTVKETTKKRKRKPARKISQTRLDTAKHTLLYSNWNTVDRIKLSCIDPDNMKQADIILIENLALNL